MYIFVDGYPDRITKEFFRTRYGAFFPALLDTEHDVLVDSIIEDVYTMFYGINSLFQGANLQLWHDKARKCYSLLVAWYITDVYPMYASGIASSSGMPLKSKSINGIKLSFGDPNDANNKTLDQLSFLKSNPFGTKAHVMIRTASRRFKIQTRRRY